MTDEQKSVDREERRTIRVDIEEWRVLIVDDQFDNVMVAREALEFHGAKVKTAENGKHGLQVLETFDPTLILLDLSMPTMNGWEMHEKLRADDRFDDTPIIALTAHVMQGDRTKVMKAGFDGYIPKPFSVATFVQRIQSILSGNAKGAS
ncbi:MAG: response regulator [Chloroflexota bacterium]